MSIENKEPDYTDPTDTKKLIDKLKECEMHDDVVDFIKEVFPTWILGWPKRYSLDYPLFKKNWEETCKKTQSRTLSVIIVDKIIFNDPKYTLLNTFADLLTLFGHSVRCKDEFIGCKLCGDAIPNETVFQRLFNAGQTDLPCWMVKCRNC
jgi:hypothetical protein